MNTHVAVFFVSSNLADPCASGLPGVGALTARWRANWILMGAGAGGGVGRLRNRPANSIEGLDAYLFTRLQWSLDATGCLYTHTHNKHITITFTHNIHRPPSIRYKKQTKIFKQWTTPMPESSQRGRLACAFLKQETITRVRVPKKSARDQVLSSKIMFDVASIAHVPNKNSEEIRRVDVKSALFIIWHALGKSPAN